MIAVRPVRSLILDSPRRAFARMSLRDIPREAGRRVSRTALIGHIHQKVGADRSRIHRVASGGDVLLIDGVCCVCRRNARD